MAYTDLQNRAFSMIAHMNLEAGYDQYCARKGTKDVPLKELLTDVQWTSLKDAGISEAELETWSISGVHDCNDSNGFYACIIETSPGNAAVGFRGSEDMGVLDNVQNDWVGADVGLVNSTCTNQQEEVRAFLEKYGKDLNTYDSLAMVGHSLGGNLAEYATIVSSEYGLDDNIKQCVSMDGPGFSEEFIEKYKEQIEKMAEVMYHPRWSCVGTMLNDLPGVEYQYVEVTNKEGLKDYTYFSRHGLEYLAYEGDSLVPGEQDALSKHTSLISKGADHLPKPIGDVLITVIGSVWIGAAWVKEQVVDDDGNLTSAGYALLTGAVGIIAAIGIEKVVIATLAVVVAVLAIVAAILLYEIVYEVVMGIVDAICTAIEAVYTWAKETYQQLKEAVVSLINKVKKWMKNLFSPGEAYAEANPTVKLDTYKLSTYAQRLQSVNKRIGTLDKRLDSLYWKVGLLGLWNLIQADLLTGYSWRLLRCADYLSDTASDFNSVETNLSNSL